MKRKGQLYPENHPEINLFIGGIPMHVACIIEAVAGLFGLLGAGWLYAGQKGRGVGLMVGYGLIFCPLMMLGIALGKDGPLALIILAHCFVLSFSVMGLWLNIRSKGL